jgi:hypothetical protein
MTERKPREMSFASWIDKQIHDAEKRGVFDNLPGAGKPLNLKPDDGADYGAAWVRDYARREGVSPEDFLPTPLKLRREAERLAESVPDMRSEQEVREVVGELNGRILQWRRMPVGPPVFVRLVDSGEMVDRWRAAQAAQAAQQAGASAQRPAAAPADPAPGARRLRGGGWWRRPRSRRAARDTRG